LEQSEKTKKFVGQVESLIDSGEVKNYAQIITAGYTQKKSRLIFSGFFCNNLFFLLA